jgi:serine/threonine protein phosphatase 1
MFMIFPSIALIHRARYRHSSGKSVIISHAYIGSVRHLYNNDKRQDTFKEYALWNRRIPPDDMPIFNIFGHTPVRYGPEITESYVNIDTGCYRDLEGYGMLSAYCVETGEVVSVKRKQSNNFSLESSRLTSLKISV